MSMDVQVRGCKDVRESEDVRVRVEDGGVRMRACGCEGVRI